MQLVDASIMGHPCFIKLKTRTLEDIDGPQKLISQRELTNEFSTIDSLSFNELWRTKYPRIREIKHDGSSLEPLVSAIPKHSLIMLKSKGNAEKNPTDSNGIVEPINCKSVEKETPQRPQSGLESIL